MKKTKKAEKKPVPFVALLLLAAIAAVILLRDDIQNLIARPWEAETENLSTESPISLKPRDKVINYHATADDTVPMVAKKFAVSQNTIRWANNLKTDTLKEGRVVKIPPVTGVVHTVKKGETVETIAAKYHTTAQNILSFPFNEYADAETHTLTPGQTLMVPNGRP